VTRRHDTVSFLSDYGLDDEFVGVVHAVIRDLAPQATVIDLTHGIAPCDVRAGSLALARSIAWVPEGVLLAVVDPGVGSARRGIAVEVAGGAGVLIGPDNGLLAPAVAMAGGTDRAVELTNTAYHLDAAAATFDGRDVFAPVAAHLCNGVDLAEFGPEVDPALLTPATIPLPRPMDEDDPVAGVVAEVLWVDRFGNCQLNVGPDDLPPTWDRHLRATLPDPDQVSATVVRAVTTVDHFAAVGGGVGLVLDAYGMFALCCDRRSAAVELSIGVGDQVTLCPGEAPQPAATPVSFTR